MAEWPEYTREDGSPLWQAAKSLAHILEDESDRWFLWVPVCFGAGIGLYFALPEEPAGVLIAAALIIALSLCAATRAVPLAWIFCVACLCAVLGFGDAKLRTESLAQSGVVKARAVMVLHGWIEKTENRLGKGQHITLRVFASPDALTTPLPRRVRYTSRFNETNVTGAAIEARVSVTPAARICLAGRVRLRPQRLFCRSWRRWFRDCPGQTTQSGSGGALRDPTAGADRWPSPHHRAPYFEDNSRATGGGHGGADYGAARPHP